MISTDAQDLAFEALLPLASPTAAALQRVDEAVRDERKMMDPLRNGFTPTLNAAALGLDRFGYAIREVGVEWAPLPAIRQLSTPVQEANNVHLWGLGAQYVLRIKRDPVECVAVGTQRLFSQLPAADRPSTIFLTWDISLAGQISAPRFVCIDEPKWTISLSQLLVHGAPPVETVSSSTTRTAIVRSKIKRDDEQSDDS